MTRRRMTGTRGAWPFALMVSTLACLGPAPARGADGGSIPASGPIVLRDKVLQVEIDPASGNIASLKNLVSGQVLLRASGDDLRKAPWMAEFLPGTKGPAPRPAIQSFRHESRGLSSARLLWKAEGGLEVESHLSLAPENGGLEIRLTARPR